MHRFLPHTAIFYPMKNENMNDPTGFIENTQLIYRTLIPTFSARGG